MFGHGIELLAKVALSATFAPLFGYVIPKSVHKKAQDITKFPSEIENFQDAMQNAQIELDQLPETPDNKIQRRDLQQQIQRNKQAINQKRAILEKISSPRAIRFLSFLRLTIIGSGFKGVQDTYLDIKSQRRIFLSTNVNTTYFGIEHGDTPALHFD